MTVSASMPTHTSREPTWTVVVPVKRLAIAKSRMGSFAVGLRSELAKAMALDCVTAVMSCSEVSRTVVVTDDPAAVEFAALGAAVLADEPDAGLNPALRHAADVLRQRHPRSPIAALSADLPALRPAELAEALRFVSGRRVAFSDHTGRGTTMLAAGPRHDLDPRFGIDSATTHRASGAVIADALTFPVVPSVRQDVDTVADLAAAIRLGVGSRTALVIARLEQNTRIA